MDMIPVFPAPNVHATFLSGPANVMVAEAFPMMLVMPGKLLTLSPDAVPETVSKPARSTKMMMVAALLDAAERSSTGTVWEAPATGSAAARLSSESPA